MHPMSPKTSAAPVPCGGFNLVDKPRSMSCPSAHRSFPESGWSTAGPATSVRQSAKGTCIRSFKVVLPCRKGPPPSGNELDLGKATSSGVELADVDHKACQQLEIGPVLCRGLSGKWELAGVQPNNGATQEACLLPNPCQ